MKCEIQYPRTCFKVIASSINCMKKSNDTLRAEFNQTCIAVFPQLFFPMVKLSQTGRGYWIKTYNYYQGRYVCENRINIVNNDTGNITMENDYQTLTYGCNTSFGLKRYLVSFDWNICNNCVPASRPDKCK